MNEKLQALAERITAERLAYMCEWCRQLGYPFDEERVREVHWSGSIVAKVKPGKKYTKIDVGDSGKYMVDNATGEIFGIKAYGVIHRGHRYGTLDTIDQFAWGDYTARRTAP